MVADCESAKQGVVDHELWDLMRAASLDQASTANFMTGIWPVIERAERVANSFRYNIFARRGEDIVHLKPIRAEVMPESSIDSEG